MVCMPVFSAELWVPCGQWKKIKSLSRLQLFATPWTVAHQASPSTEFSRHEHWSGLPFPSPGDLPNPAIESGSPVLQTDTLPSEPPGNLILLINYLHTHTQRHILITISRWGFPGDSVVKNAPANAGNVGSLPGWGRSPGAGNGNPLQESCPGNPMDRGAWWATFQAGLKESATT